jgi:2-iminoacetate synthase
MQFGVSQIDGGTNIEIGGYTKNLEIEQDINKEQFIINDNRSLNEIMDELIKNEYIPSFCTACYRLGRTGEHFMEFSVPGFIKRYCTPNAMLTMVEYLEDYAPEATKKQGYELIEKKMSELEDDKYIAHVKERIEQIKQGKRDLYF